MGEAILGLSAYYHDSAAALLIEGKIVAAAHEERFTRKKHDPSFPAHAVRYVLQEAGIDSLSDLTAVAFYDKPYLKFERLLETYHGFAPRGIQSFLSAIPVWIKGKLFLRRLLKQELARIAPGDPKLLFPEHHLSHAASAFYPSPFDEAAILTVDGVGEWATATIAYGKENKIQLLRELNFPHSLGLLYSAFTYYCGFKVNSGEYKLMGLAPYGNPGSPRLAKWTQLILDELVDLREDGSFLLNMAYFNFATGLTMCDEEKWERLLGVPRRLPETDLSQPYTDLALVIQQLTEEILVRLANTAQQLTGSCYLAMAGGVALNCVANSKILSNGSFKDVWIQPAAGDAGGSVGAAYAAWHIWLDRERTVELQQDSMQGGYLGPEFSSIEINRVVRKFEAPHKFFEDFDQLCSETAELLAQGYVIGWFQGRMEFGPRALGNRSILGDPRDRNMQKKLNLTIKFREGFRPFAPSVLEEDLEEYFDFDRSSPYMLFIAPVKEHRRNPIPADYFEQDLWERLYYPRSDIPAVTHIDYSARIQSVSRRTNDRYWKLIKSFKDRVGYGLIVNTSFNIRGEPIICTPSDAYRCFMKTGMDYLVMGNYLFDKKMQKRPVDLAELGQPDELD